MPVIMILFYLSFVLCSSEKAFGKTLVGDDSASGPLEPPLLNGPLCFVLFIPNLYFHININLKCNVKNVFFCKVFLNV